MLYRNQTLIPHERVGFGHETILPLMVIDSNLCQIQLNNIEINLFQVINNFLKQYLERFLHCWKAAKPLHGWVSDTVIVEFCGQVLVKIRISGEFVLLTLLECEEF